jgi:cellulose synthase/poly-beta-1,6-N-acetylglucosamine synthase-like glycosyltransferase
MAAKKLVEVQHGPYRIQRSDPIPVPLELRHREFFASNITTWSLWLCYTIFQLNFARLVQNKSPNSMWRVWIVLAAEVCLSFQELVLGINLIFALFYAREGSTRPRYSLMGNAAPHIDVFVTCCGEPNGIILDTVAAAIAQDYPTQQFRAFLLDDGHNAELHAAIQLLSKQSSATGGPKVYYLSREVRSGVKSFFKAGNLQFGIEESHRLGRSEFIASLDADMIPEKNWLRRIIPHLILSGDIALACTPQVHDVEFQAAQKLT